MPVLLSLKYLVKGVVQGDLLHTKDRAKTLSENLLNTILTSTNASQGTRKLLAQYLNVNIHAAIRSESRHDLDALAAVMRYLRDNSEHYTEMFTPGEQQLVDSHEIVRSLFNDHSDFLANMREEYVTAMRTQILHYAITKKDKDNLQDFGYSRYMSEQNITELLAYAHRQLKVRQKALYTSGLQQSDIMTQSNMSQSAAQGATQSHYLQLIIDEYTLIAKFLQEMLTDAKNTNTLNLMLQQIDSFRERILEIDNAEILTHPIANRMNALKYVISDYLQNESFPSVPPGQIKSTLDYNEKHLRGNVKINLVGDLFDVQYLLIGPVRKTRQKVGWYGDALDVSKCRCYTFEIHARGSSKAAPGACVYIGEQYLDSKEQAAVKCRGIIYAPEIGLYEGEVTLERPQETEAKAQGQVRLRPNGKGRLIDPIGETKEKNDWQQISDEAGNSVVFLRV